jgi:hypothetical protein
MITCTAGFEFAIDKQRALAVASFGSQRVPGVVVQRTIASNSAILDFDHQTSVLCKNDPMHGLVAVAVDVGAFRSE